MHCHSGQFCPGHAVDQLEDIIRHAISVGFETIGLTEHMPRYEEQDLYPEELDDPEAQLSALPVRHEAYLVEAERLRAKYAGQIHILVGFESEFIRPKCASRVRALFDAPPTVDYFIGSVHHVHGLPIDYDTVHYARAVDVSGGSEESLFEDYYDLQYDMLRALRPRVVGHFDLIRLLSKFPSRDVRQWNAVWEKVRRNLALVREQGGWIECNTAALRKGLAEPYPCRIIAEEWLKIGGKFTMSDDSHGIAHVATNYARGIAYLESLGVEHVWTFRRKTPAGVESSTKAVLEDTPVSLEDFKRHFKIEKKPPSNPVLHQA
ncbi:hypothetical protein RJ55_04133 [Drechmeria coniospora]|nr:hypothetical protein RJ55_04133 [Drechmeria coniospora]